ncbi:MAG TPA: RluA family pseudouridine synthase [Candidatus Anaerotignum merdipullorum]|nr:RluA family pseudouridine synthase [Candidatus Anaerotignum merdipullorum]
MAIRILYEDDDMMAVEKPQGMPSQPDKTGDLDVLSAISAQCKMSVGLVHRLDRPVGGLMLLAKTKSAEAALAKAMQNKEWEKSYLAVLCGRLTEPSGTWTDYLWKNARTNLSQVVSQTQKGAKRAVLYYTVLEEREVDGQWISLVRIRLETGRHHQIRVQSAAHGVPVWGDRKYHWAASSYAQRTKIALWSYQWKGVHPRTKQQMTITCLPKENPYTFFSEKLGEM